MKIDPNAPAYPRASTVTPSGIVVDAANDGMSIRAAMATKIMAGMLADSDFIGEPEQAAKIALAYADALIAALNAGGGQ